MIDATVEQYESVMMQVFDLYDRASELAGQGETYDVIAERLRAVIAVAPPACSDFPLFVHITLRIVNDNKVEEFTCGDDHITWVKDFDPKPLEWLTTHEHEMLRHMAHEKLGLWYAVTT